MNKFLINEKKSFDLFQYPEYLLPHKKSEIVSKSDSFIVNYKKHHNLGSSGFRIPFQTIPNQSYKLELQAKLVDGDQAFIYCESEDYTRIIPRIYFFTPGKTLDYELTFVAKDGLTWIGILFYYGTVDYQLKIKSFKITEYQSPQQLQQHSEQHLEQHLEQQQSVRSDELSDESDSIKGEISSIQLGDEYSESCNSSNPIEDFQLSRETIEKLKFPEPCIGKTNFPSKTIEETQSFNPQKKEKINLFFPTDTKIFEFGSGFQESDRPTVNSTVQSGFGLYDDLIPSKQELMVIKQLGCGEKIDQSQLVKRLAVLPFSTDTMIRAKMPLTSSMESLKGFNPSYVGTKIVVSLFSNYNELESLKIFIEELLNVKKHTPDLIYINIPYHFPEHVKDDKFHEDELNDVKIPVWLTENSHHQTKIKINHCPDWGDLTKLFGILPLETDPKTIIVLFSPQYLNIYNTEAPAKHNSTFNALFESSVENLLNLNTESCSRAPLSYDYLNSRTNRIAFSNLGIVFDLDNKKLEWSTHNLRSNPVISLSSLGGLAVYREFFDNGINQLQTGQRTRMEKKCIGTGGVSEISDLLLSDYLLNKGFGLAICSNSIQKLILPSVSDIQKEFEAMAKSGWTMPKLQNKPDDNGFLPLVWSRNTLDITTAVPSTAVPSTSSVALVSKAVVSAAVSAVTPLRQKSVIPFYNPIAATDSDHSEIHCEPTKSRFNWNYFPKNLQSLFKSKKPTTIKNNESIIDESQQSEDQDKSTVLDSDKVIRLGKGYSTICITNPIKASITPGSKVAVIVELRKDHLLVDVIAHFMNILNDSWKIQIFHGMINKEMVRNAPELGEGFKTNRIILSGMRINNITKNEYSRLLLNAEFYRQCVGEHILVFQMDSCLNPNSKIKIEKFLDWDYIGAPWPPSKSHKSLINVKKRIYVGNGGLSLRRRNTMLKVCDLIKNRYEHLLKYNEDMVISSILGSNAFPNVKIPDWQLAKKFSVEKIYEPGAVGTHRAWDYLTPSEFVKIKKENPELVRLFKGRFFK